MIKKSYTQLELSEILRSTPIRDGWDFSLMNTTRQTVPWEYLDIVRKYVNLDSTVLDIGTGGGEKFISLATIIKSGLGIDADQEMISKARANAKNLTNLDFLVDTHQLNDINRNFTVIINRHAPYDLNAISNHLEPSGYFITQQVGEKNMSNIKEILGQDTTTPVISISHFKDSSMNSIAFMEYNVEYVVEDIESLVFWLQALDAMHADIEGISILSDIDLFNQLLRNNVDERGFVTNEHRYLVIAQQK